MYYCWKCRRYHIGGAIARKHRIFSVKGKNKKRTHKKSTTVKRRAKTKKITKKHPLIIKKEIKTKPKTIKREKKTTLRMPTGRISKRRKMQLIMKPTDIYERQMIERIRRKTGMTHLQVSHLVNQARDLDIDTETIISEVAGLSNDKKELYEFALRRIQEEKRRRLGGERWNRMSEKALGDLIDKYRIMYEDYYGEKPNW